MRSHQLASATSDDLAATFERLSYIASAPPHSRATVHGFAALPGLPLPA